MKKDELLQIIFNIESQYENLFVGMDIYDAKFNANGLASFCEDGNGIKIYVGDTEGADDFIIYYSYKPEYANNPAYENAICLNQLEPDRIKIIALNSLLTNKPIKEINAFLES